MMLMFIDCGPGSVVAELTQMAQTELFVGPLAVGPGRGCRRTPGLYRCASTEMA